MIQTLLLLVIGLVILIFAADLLVRGASDLARRFGVSSLIIGLTVVAFGTSAPELFVSSAAALKGSADVAIGNVLGSSIFNILVIVGVAGLLAPFPASKEIINKEMPIMLFSAFCFWAAAAFISPGVITSLEGCVLFSFLVLYLLQTYLSFHRDRSTQILEEKVSEQHDLEVASHSAWKDGAKIILGLIGLVAGSELIVASATEIARALGVSEFVIGVTLIAGGTSLPELATTILAAWKKEAELAIGNAVGSNIFNVFCVIGISSFIEPLNVAESNIDLDFPIMFAACFLAWLLVLIRKGVSRPAGLSLITVYGLYIVFLIQRG